jgi:hypothetical protein
MGVIVEHFRTLESLVDTIETREYNKIFKTGEKSSQSRSNSDWYGTSSYNQSIQLIKDGFKEPLETMKKAVLKIDKQNTYTRPKTYLSPIGYAPNVPNALKGVPNSMINRERKQVQSKTIHLLYGFSAIGTTSPRDLIKGGTMFIGLVNSLERQGFRVKLDLVRCTTASTTDAIAYTVNLKEYSQSLNLLKLCYPLVHPSMLRRTSFKWCETLPDLEDGRYYGTMGQSLIIRMGYQSNREQACIKEKEFLKKHGIIKEANSYYCNVYEAMHSRDINELAQKMGLSR